jgi:hypothetical protein
MTTWTGSGPLIESDSDCGNANVRIRFDYNPISNLNDSRKLHVEHCRRRILDDEIIAEIKPGCSDTTSSTIWNSGLFSKRRNSTEKRS